MTRVRMSALVVILVLLAQAVFVVTPVKAAAITVTSLLDIPDAGRCRLRDAISAANSNTAVGDCPAGSLGQDTIGFNLGLKCSVTLCSIPLKSALPTVTEDLTINGSGITIDGGNGFRVFDLGAVTVSMSNLRIANGDVTGVSFGGGIFMTDGNLTLTNVTFSNNRAISGGAIYESKGSVTVTNSHFLGNIAGVGGAGGAIFTGNGSLAVIESSFENNSAANGGGAIAATSAVTILNSTFTGNSAPLGGAIENSLASLTVDHSVFDHNTSNGFGGAIAAFGSTNLFNSTLSNNQAVGAASQGGAVYFQSANGALTITESALFNNSAVLDGGALMIVDGPVTFRNVTISANSAGRDGGGIFITQDVQGPTTMTLNNVTITNNLADSNQDGSGDGGGIFRAAGSAQILNSILAGNFDTPGNAGSGSILPDCAGSFSSQGHNLVGRNDGCSGFTDGVNGDQVGSGASPINPLLSDLADHGGPTLTHALIPGSPAIDAGGFNCAGTDQRGITRPQGAACDIGAVEAKPGDVQVSVFLPNIPR